MKVINLTVAFGERVVFDNFSYEFISPGIYFVNAPSGRGKTTLFNVISGLIKPNKGKVEHENKKISYMFQEDRLFYDFTVLENVRCVASGEKSDESCIEILRELGLGDELSSYPSSLSGGMKRRVALARALCYDSDILLLDEPFKGLDEQTCKTAADTVIRHTRGKLVIIAAHMPDKSMLGEYTELTL